MEAIYSSVEDCRSLTRKLYESLGSKLSFDGIITETPFGKYHMIPSKKYQSFDDFQKDAVSFNFKCKENGFIRVTVEEEFYHLSEGLKLAVLSDFCRVITKHYGMPSFFYTIANDENHSLNIQWSFDHAKEDLEYLTDGTYFDDAVVDTLIEFKTPTKDKEKLYEEAFNLTGLPYELMDYVLLNNEDFLDAKAERPPIRKKEELINGRTY